MSDSTQIWLIVFKSGESKLLAADRTEESRTGDPMVKFYKDEKKVGLLRLVEIVGYFDYSVLLQPKSDADAARAAATDSAAAEIDEIELLTQDEEQPERFDLTKHLTPEQLEAIRRLPRMT